MTLDEILGYPQLKIDKHPPAAIIHKCGIYKPGHEYKPPKEPHAPKHSTSTVDHTGMTATQRKILAVLKKAGRPMAATEVAKIIKQTSNSVSMNMAKMSDRLERKLIKNGQVRWYEYVPKS